MKIMTPMEKAILSNEIEGFIYTEKERKFLKAVEEGKISEEEAEKIIMRSGKELNWEELID